jgi:hypothetical protein
MGGSVVPFHICPGHGGLIEASGGIGRQSVSCSIPAPPAPGAKPDRCAEPRRRLAAGMLARGRGCRADENSDTERRPTADARALKPSDFAFDRGLVEERHNG